MSTAIHTNRNRLPLLAGAAVATVAVIAGAAMVLLNSQRTGQKTGTDTVVEAAQRLPPPGEAGKVGDLVITQEAMELAEIKLAAATQRSVAEKLAASGTIEPGGDRLVRITPRVAGKVITVSTMVGDQVRAGQTVATIESTELAKAQAEYEHAEIGLAIARKNLERQRKLARLGAFSSPRYEEARREVVAAEGDANGAEKDVAAVRQEVSKAKSARAALQGEVAEAEADVASAENDAASAGSQVARAESGVKSLQAALSQTQTGVQVARSRFNRLDTLLKEEIVSRQDWEQARGELQRAEADVEAARSNIAQSQAEVEAARSAQRSAQSKVTAAKAKVKSARDRVEQAAADIEGASARTEQAEARLAAARKRAELARRALAREERVFRGGYATSKEIVEAEGALQEAQHELEHSVRAVRLLGSRPGGGSTIPVVTPIAGRVQARKVSVGQTVEAEHELFSVINLDLVWAQLQVAPKDLPYVRTGERVVLTSETAPGRTFTGTVSAIDTVADETTRTVRVRVALVNRDGALRPETFVRGHIVTDVRRERVTVPEKALQDHQGKPTVYIARNTAGAFEVRHVKLGVRGDGWREVAEGLQPGERIAADGTFYLKSEALKSSLSDGCCAPGK
jgi:RND family efflux transporter MFP subunit